MCRHTCRPLPGNAHRKTRHSSSDLLMNGAVSCRTAAHRRSDAGAARGQHSHRQPGQQRAGGGRTWPRSGCRETPAVRTQAATSHQPRLSETRTRILTSTHLAHLLHHRRPLLTFLRPCRRPRPPPPSSPWPLRPPGAPFRWETSAECRRLCWPGPTPRPPPPRRPRPSSSLPAPAWSSRRLVGASLKWRSASASSGRWSAGWRSSGRCSCAPSRRWWFTGSWCRGYPETSSRGKRT